MAKYARPMSLSSTTDRACEVRLRVKSEGRYISPYSIITFLLHISPPNLHFLNFLTVIWNIWNLQHCLRLWLIRLEEIADRFCWIKTKSKHCVKTMSIYWHQKNKTNHPISSNSSINGDRQCCPWALSSVFFFRSICTTFVLYTYFARYDASNHRFLYV